MAIFFAIVICMPWNHSSVNFDISLVPPPFESTFQCHKVNRDSDRAINIKQLLLLEYVHKESKKELRIMKEIAGKWNNIGILLDCSVNQIAKNHNMGTDYSENCCQNMLMEWLGKGAPGYPVSWNSLIKVIRDVELYRVASNIELALECVNSLLE